MTKEEVLAGLQACAQKLGRTPKYAEVQQMMRLPRVSIEEHFGTLAGAFRAARIEPRALGHRVQTSALFEDWARVARKVGKEPALADYRTLGEFSVRPFFERFQSWRKTPACFRAWAQEQNMEKEFADVLAMIPARERQKDLRVAAEQVHSACSNDAIRKRKRLRMGRPLYGAPLNIPGMRYAPVNEAGVLYLFGRVAHRLDFEVEHMQAEFPDCEAMREIEPGRWQRVRIEFEYASRNFLTHKHPVDGCDIIVCWIHNWPECPENLEVIELRTVVRGEHRVIG